MTPDKTIALRCAAGCEMLTFDAWDIHAPDTEWYAEIYVRPAKRFAWGWRIKRSFELLLGREPYTGDLTLQCEEIHRLRDFLNDCYPATSTTGGSAATEKDAGEGT